jgi:hypothetical protein
MRSTRRSRRASATIATSCGGLTSGDAGAPDAVADAPADAASAKDGFSFPDTGPADVSQPDTGIADVIIDYRFPPPPYGCVFPEGCGDVKV